MKVRQNIEINGIENVTTIKDLATYANQLADEFGEETEYSVGGYDWQEYITINRDETESEKFKRELIEEAYTKLRRCSDVTTHTFWRDTLGQKTYVEIINNLNQEK